MNPPTATAAPITIFCTPKPFVGHFDLIQRNALQNWHALAPVPEILVFGDEPGAAEAAERVGAVHIPQVRRNAHGTPLISDMFSVAQRRASNSVLCYTNADILFFPDLFAAIAVAEAQPRPYLLTGRRHDVDVVTPIDFTNAGAVRELIAHAREAGKRYPPLGMDYFVFQRGKLPTLPDFAVGRPRWDNYMLYHARKHKLLVIDATDAIFAIHQNHDYSHHKAGTRGVWEGAEAQANLDLAGGWDYIFTLKNATHTMNSAGKLQESRLQSPFEKLSEFGALHTWSRRPLGLARRAKRRVLGHGSA